MGRTVPSGGCQSFVLAAGHTWPVWPQVKYNQLTGQRILIQKKEDISNGKYRA
jgi:hypothetical protein